MKYLSILLSFLLLFSGNLVAMDGQSGYAAVACSLDGVDGDDENSALSTPAKKKKQNNHEEELTPSKKILKKLVKIGDMRYSSGAFTDDVAVALTDVASDIRATHEAGSHVKDSPARRVRMATTKAVSHVFSEGPVRAGDWMESPGRSRVSDSVWKSPGTAEKAHRRLSSGPSATKRGRALAAFLDAEETGPASAAALPRGLVVPSPSHIEEAGHTDSPRTAVVTGPGFAAHGGDVATFKVKPKLPGKKGKKRKTTRLDIGGGTRAALGLFAGSKEVASKVQPDKRVVSLMKDPTTGIYTIRVVEDGGVLGVTQYPVFKVGEGGVSVSEPDLVACVSHPSAKCMFTGADGTEYVDILKPAKALGISGVPEFGSLIFEKPLTSFGGAGSGAGGGSGKLGGAGGGSMSKKLTF